MYNYKKADELRSSAFFYFSCSQTINAIIYDDISVQTLPRKAKTPAPPCYTESIDNFYCISARQKLWGQKYIYSKRYLILNIFCKIVRNIT